MEQASNLARQKAQMKTSSPLERFLLQCSVRQVQARQKHRAFCTYRGGLVPHAFITFTTLDRAKRLATLDDLRKSTDVLKSAAVEYDYPTPQKLSLIL